MANDNKPQGPPTPELALKRLNRLVGTWSMKGHTLGPNNVEITGTTSFKWLHQPEGAPTGFYLQQDMEMDYGGQLIKSHELIGYNPKTRAFSSYVYSNMAAEPWPYEWDLRDDVLTISVKYGELDSTFTGKFAADGNTFSGGWRPNPGADETINAPYDIGGSRLK
ncbi:MAG: DUF1579 family protein [Kofleriaceae bacterium]